MWVLLSCEEKTELNWIARGLRYSWQLPGVPGVEWGAFLSFEHQTIPELLL